MRLSDTPEAQEWLGQFKEADRPFAELLLDGLLLVSEETLVRELQQLIENEVLKVELPVALVPVREMEDNQSYYGHSSNKNAKAKLLFSDSFPGSEAIVANIAERQRRLDTKRKIYVVNPSLRNMRKAKCRSVFFVDDLIGSGTRMIKFLNAYERHRTIKSWYSLKLIRSYSVVYTLTDTGRKRVLKRKCPPQIHYVRKCPTFDNAPWTTEQQKMVKDVCLRYAPYSKDPLGYDNTAGLLIFEHSVPNNVPAILWEERGGWAPLFPGRAVPTDLAAMFKLPPIERDIKDKLRALGQERLAKGKWQAVADPYIQKIILVLSSLTRKARSIERISDYTALSMLEAEGILVACQKWELVDDFSLTDSGRGLLAKAKNIKEKEKQVLALNTDFYYPHSLRKA